MVITPDQLSVELVPGESQSTVLSIANVGQEVLPFTLSEDPAADRLVLDPISGTVLKAESQEVTATFSASGLDVGVYTTTLEAASNDPFLPIVEIPVTLTVGCAPVEGADFVWMPTLPLVGEVVTFTASATGTPPLLFAWSFGDDTGGLGEIQTHTYQGVGEYTVMMTATNCAASPVVVTHTVSVTQTCEALEGLDFSWSPITPFAGEVVTFTAVASGSSPVTFDWLFGDGEAGSGAVIAHGYAAGGTYTVILTANNCAGAPLSIEYVLNVLPKIYLPVIVR